MTKPMIDINELRADIEVGTPGKWMAAPYSSVVGAPIVSSPTGRSIGQVTYFDLGGNFSGHDRESDANARRIARLPQLEREYLAMREALNDANAVHVNLLAGKIARPTIAQIIHIYGEDALRLALNGETQ